MTLCSTYMVYHVPYDCLWTTLQIANWMHTELCILCWTAIVITSWVLPSLTGQRISPPSLLATTTGYCGELKEEIWSIPATTSVTVQVSSHQNDHEANFYANSDPFTPVGPANISWNHTHPENYVFNATVRADFIVNGDTNEMNITISSRQNFMSTTVILESKAYVYPVA